MYFKMCLTFSFVYPFLISVDFMCGIITYVNLIWMLIKDKLVEVYPYIIYQSIHTMCIV